jgi:hypothetical protein
MLPAEKTIRGSSGASKGSAHPTAITDVFFPCVLCSCFGTDTERPLRDPEVPSGITSRESRVPIARAPDQSEIICFQGPFWSSVFFSPYHRVPKDCSDHGKSAVQ